MGTRDAYVATIKSAFVSIGTKGLTGVIHGAAPWTLNPIANYIIEHVLAKILEELSDLAEVQAFFIYIDFRVSAQGKAFYEAALANVAAKNKSPEEKARAEKHLIDTAREFIKLSA